MVKEIVGNSFVEKEHQKTESSTLDDSFTTATLDNLEPETTGTAISTLPKTTSLQPFDYGQHSADIDRSQNPRSIDIAKQFDHPDSGFMSSHHVENLKDAPNRNLNNGSRSRTQSIDHVTTPRPVRPPPPDSQACSDEYRIGLLFDMNF